MQSATSSYKNWFYPTLWKKNMTRFWPLWTGYTIILLFMLPLNLAVNYRWDDGAAGLARGYHRFSQLDVLRYAEEAGILLTLMLSILAVMAVFSYLYQGKSVDLLHSLPVRRSGLFLTNYLSGLSFLILPAGAVYLITLVVEAAHGCLAVRELSLWLACMVLYSLFFCSFATFCAMFTGHILALPAFYGILNGLVAGVYVLINNVLRQFVFGLEGTTSGRISEVVVWLTPVARLMDDVSVRTTWGKVSGTVESIQFEGLGTALVYALAGLVLAGLALAIYRRRHLELAGDVVAVNWVRPIFKYGVAFCTALAGGCLLYSWFGWNLSSSGWSLLAFMLPCGVVGYYVAQMLLKKSFQVFRNGSWKGCVVLLLCLTASVAALELDLTGYERRVPQVDQVASVRVRNRYSAPYDDGSNIEVETEDLDLIARIIQMHASVIQDYREESADWRTYGTAANQDTMGEYAEGSASISLCYTLKNGSEMERRYSLSPITSAMLKDPTSAAAQLQAFINLPESGEGAYFPADISNWRLVEAFISVPSDKTVDNKNWSSSSATISEEIPAEYRDDLLAAVQSDLAAGRLGQRYLIDDAQRLNNCYYNDLTFVFYIPGGTAQSTNETVYADGFVGTESILEPRSNRSVSITVQATATDTLAVLEKMGCKDKLVTQAEVQRYSD